MLNRGRYVGLDNGPIFQLKVLAITFGKDRQQSVDSIDRDSRRLKPRRTNVFVQEKEPARRQSPTDLLKEFFKLEYVVNGRGRQDSIIDVWRKASFVFLDSFLVYSGASLYLFCHFGQSI